MKIPVRILIVTSCLVMTISSLGLLKVGAQESPINDEQISRIRTSCATALNTINQLHASDALLRVNRGQLYESILGKLMQPFNTRASRTGYTITDLTSISDSYQKTLNTFRTDYQTYEEQLSSTLNIDCLKQPVEFYNAVDLSRSQRNTVHDDTVHLNQYITDYQAAVKAFEQHYDLQTTEGTTN